MANPLERYQKLGIRESLPREYRYPIACKELSFILRGAYVHLPKNLKSALFEDTIAAFRLLPEMKTQSAVSAATLLFQAAEAALPKQKKILAVTEYKRAKIAYKKQCRMWQESSDSAHLPHDLLLHIFSFLDFQSLISAGLVCWAWNAAASDSSVWKSQCMCMFGAGVNDNKKWLQDKLPGLIQEGTSPDWKEIFKRTYIGNTNKRFISNRGYCRQCKAIVWLNNLACSNQHTDSKLSSNKIKPISQQQVVDYICNSSLDSDSDGDSDPCCLPFDCGSDSDSGWDQVSRLWAYPKLSR